jgi:hypothetical protein
VGGPLPRPLPPLTRGAGCLARSGRPTYPSQQPVGREDDAGRHPQTCTPRSARQRGEGPGEGSIA